MQFWLVYSSCPSYYLKRILSSCHFVAAHIPVVGAVSLKWWSLPLERCMSSGHLASTVCPHVGGKADLSSTMMAADCADQVTRWRCLFRAGVCRKSLAPSALLYLDSNAVLLEVLHTGVTDFAPFWSVAGECLPVSWVYAGGLQSALSMQSVCHTVSPRVGVWLWVWSRHLRLLAGVGVLIPKFFWHQSRSPANSIWTVLHFMQKDVTYIDFPVVSIEIIAVCVPALIN